MQKPFRRLVAGKSDRDRQRRVCGCEALTFVKLPVALETVGSLAFDSCANLTTVRIPGRKTVAFGEGAFRYDSAIESVTFGGSLAAWAGHYFANQTANPLSVSSAKLEIDGEDVTGDVTITTGTVSAFAFCRYDHFTSLTRNVQKVEGNAFSYCDGLVSVSFASTVTTLGSRVGGSPSWSSPFAGEVSFSYAGSCESYRKITGGDTLTSKYTVVCTDGSLDY